MSNPFADDDPQDIPDHTVEEQLAVTADDPDEPAAEPENVAPADEDHDEDAVDEQPVTAVPVASTGNPDDPNTWGPLFSVMPATPHSAATTLANWCVCAEEIPRDPAWAPLPDASPWLVITATRDIEGIRRARQLAGALASTRARVAAIVLLEPAPAKGSSGGIRVKEMIAAAESAGTKIITLPYDNYLPGNTEPPERTWPWSPKDASNISVPTGLDRVYTTLFFTITDQMMAKTL